MLTTSTPVRWALASAREADRHVPVLKTLLLLEGEGREAPPYTRWLEYPEVVKLARFRPCSIARLAADAWKGSRRPSWPACAGRNARP